MRFREEHWLALEQVEAVAGKSAAGRQDHALRGAALGHLDVSRDEPVRAPDLPEPPVQRHADATTRADAVHRHEGGPRQEAHLPRDRREHRRPEVEAQRRSDAQTVERSSH